VAKVRAGTIQPAHPSYTRPAIQTHLRYTHAASQPRASLKQIRERRIHTYLPALTRPYPARTVGSLKVWSREFAWAPLHCLRLSAHAALVRARLSSLTPELYNPLSEGVTARGQKASRQATANSR